MFLVYPPAARTTEPPLGIARLAGFLRAAGRQVRCIDLCREGIDWLLRADIRADDTPTRLALRRRERDLALIRDPAAYASPDRVKRAILGLNESLAAAAGNRGVEAGLADYRDRARSPLRRADLVSAAANFEDNVFYPLFRSRIAEELAAFPTDTIGISVNYLSQALCAFALAGFVKAAFPGTRVILGGGLVSSWTAQGSLRADERFGGLVDAILPGRGEAALAGPELPARESVAPDFDDFRPLDYLAPERILPYNFSHGCPWKRCTFCPEKAEDAPYFGLHPETALAELRTLAGKYEPGLFHFTDNEIAPSQLRALAQGVTMGDPGEPPGVPWYGFARFSPVLDDPGFCLKLAASGCRMLQLGLESGDQGVLDALCKGTELGMIDRILVNLAEAGIAVYLYVLFGTPAENRDAALRTRDFVASRSNRIGFLNVAIFNMPIAGDEARSLPTKAFYDGDLSLYREFAHPALWNRAEVRAFLAKEFESSPGIKAILARNPPVFTSNLAPFFPSRSLPLQSEARSD
ncbi:MAG: radical SAM protein [Spirochaetes bacterium]|nr:radical SAM protein [Spirochaetota bacterium]